MALRVRIGAFRSTFIAVAIAVGGLGSAILSPGGDGARAAAPGGCYSTSGVSGYATKDNGRPLVGATVLLSTEKNPAHAKVGRQFKDRKLGSTTTTKDGCYQIPVEATHALFASADAYGVINFQLTIQRPGALEVVVIPRRLQVTSNRMALRPVGTVGSQLSLTHARTLAESDAPVSGAIYQSFGPQAAHARAAMESAPTPRIRVAGMVGRSTDANVGLRPDVIKVPASFILTEGSSAKEKVAKVFAPHTVLVGQWWSRMDGITQTWRYSKGSTTQLESALSTGGGPLSYSKSQTYAKSTNASVTFPGARGRGGVLYRTNFRYAKYLIYYCSELGCQPFATRVKPYSWERGTAVQRGVPYPAVTSSNCSKYAAGSIDESEGTTAVTWTNGVEIAGDIKTVVGGSLSLSSQTGFTSRAENVVKFSKSGWLCGTFGPLSKTPGTLLARRW